MGAALDRIGNLLGSWLTRPIHNHGVSRATPPDKLRRCLQPGDVLLIEGNTRVSAAIKYLTQSTWSHAALFVGEHALAGMARPGHCFVEADIVDGVRSAGIEQFEKLPSRICRPVGLNPDEISRLVNFMIERIGHRYDLRNIVDLARYLVPTPPVPQRFRRRMLSLGSGDPTRAICSTLIAQAFQSLHYPILPESASYIRLDPDCHGCETEVFNVRHYSLFVPRDFDVSPYFEIIKPTLAEAFDYRSMVWDDTAGIAPEVPVQRRLQHVDPQDGTPLSSESRPRGRTSP